MHLEALFEKTRSVPDEAGAAVFRQLLDALEHDAPFDLRQLDRLSYADFDLALNALKEWRSQRYVRLRDHAVAQSWRSHLS